MTDAIPAETWRPIAGFDGYYEVSDRGRVRSPSRVLSIYTGDHYSKIRLKAAGRGSTKNVHQLVASAFLGPCPEGMEVCHNNGDHHDNRVENLRYDTHSNNQLDTVRMGRNFFAKRTHCNRGHEFTPENTIQRTGSKESGRRCRTCDTARGKRRWQEELALREKAS